MREWKPFETAPKDGRRIELKREGCMHSEKFPVTGAYLGGSLVLSAMFVDPRTRQMFTTPTHWREQMRQGQQVNDGGRSRSA